MADRIQGLKLKLPGVNKILRASQPKVDEVGQRMAASAGDGFAYQAKPHRWTARGYVSTVNARGRRREAQDKALTRSVGGS